MNLVQAAALLEAHSGNFSDTYKLFQFKDDQPLRDYLDFIQHEPVEWIKGFPAKYTHKVSFAKPKTAVVKLLKQPAVSEALGAEYVAKAYRCVWDTFKTHGENILAERVRKASVVAQLEETESTNSASGAVGAPRLVVEDTLEADAESVHSVRGPRRPLAPAVTPVGVDWEARYKQLRIVVDAILEHHKSEPLYGALLTLLDHV